MKTKKKDEGFTPFTIEITFENMDEVDRFQKMIDKNSRSIDDYNNLSGLLTIEKNKIK